MAPETWQSGLFDCFSDCKSCCLTYWCPCVTFGRIGEIVSKGTKSCCELGTMYTVYCCLGRLTCFQTLPYRSRIRQQYNLEGTWWRDFLAHVFCHNCALCQEYRELQSRGFNMTIGWQGNVDERKNEVGMGPMPPKVEEGMNRNK